MKLAEMEAKIREYKQFKREAEQYEEFAQAIASELKQAMEAEGLTSAIVGEYKLTFSDSKRESLDKARLIQDLGDLSDYTKTTFYKTFRVA